MASAPEIQAADSPTRRARTCSVASSSSPGSGKGGKQKMRRASSLPTETVEYLKAWMMSPEHIAHPYPTEQEKSKIMSDTGIELKQLTNWFVNNRKRFWKPQVEARMQQQQKAATAATTTTSAAVVSPNHLRESKFSDQDSVSSAVLDMASKSTGLRPKATSFLPRHGSSSSLAHLISEASSSASESGNMSDDSSVDDMITEEVDRKTGMIKHTEPVQVHILRPISFSGAPVEPTIEDVSILPNVPSSRILYSYPSCTLSYTFPPGGRKKAQSCRDAEVVRIKKHYLKLFLSDENAVLSSRLLAKRKPPVEEEDIDNVVVKRAKYSRASPDLWRDSCRDANHGFCDSLPSMDEAVSLFGFTVHCDG